MQHFPKILTGTAAVLGSSIDGGSSMRRSQSQNDLNQILDGAGCTSAVEGLEHFGGDNILGSRRTWK